MKLFKTSNGITMLECLPFNWTVDYLYREDLNDRLQRSKDQKNPLTFSIFIGGFSHSIHFNYNPLEQLLIFNEVAMKVNTFSDASMFVDNCIKGLMTNKQITEEITGHNQNYGQMSEKIYTDKPTKMNYNNVSNQVNKDFDLLMKQYKKLFRIKKLKTLL